MRQPATTIMVGLCLVLAPWAQGGTAPEATGNGPIPKAKRLIEAGDHAAALTILEDALLEVPDRDRPAILELLRKSYEVLARKAEASGRAREAAHYRDNLAILDRSRETGPQSRTLEPQAKPSIPAEAPAPIAPPTRPKSAPAGMPADDVPLQAPPAERPPIEPTPGPLLSPALPILAEPAPLPEPEGIPAPVTPPGRVAMPARPDTPAPRDPGVATDPNARPPAGAKRIPDVGRPMAAESAGERDGGHGATPGLLPPRDAAPDAADVEINPGSGTPEAESGNPGDPEPPPVASPRPEAAPTEPPARERPATDPDLDRADHLFTAGQYDVAGGIYATLAGQDRLPTDRRPHWAYCRAKSVCRKINGRPRSSAEWDAIEAEVREIQKLTPGHWVAEYLRNLVAEGRGGRRRTATRPNDVIIRGSEPDEVQPPARRLRGLFGKPRGAIPAQPEKESAPAPSAPDPERALNLPGPAPGSEPFLAIDGETAPGGTTGAPARAKTAPPEPRAEGGAGSDPIAWQVHETANFRIFHCDLATARRAGEVAESVRSAQARRWTSPAARSAWTPRCDLYLHPNPRSYAEATGQPEVSPGVSTMANDGTRVVSRRMNLRADNPRLLTATLPHEVTHIVLADVFVAQQIPRWADEGIAVLAEPLAEQRNRAADLHEPLESGQIFPVGQLMKMDYPDQKDWRLFYAQSVSLTRYLVDQGPPERFIQFVRDSQRTGADAAVRDIYQIEGLDELHNRWAAHARKQIAVDTASSRNADSQPPSTTR